MEFIPNSQNMAGKGGHLVYERLSKAWANGLQRYYFWLNFR